jgi:hypothetical protein
MQSRSACESQVLQESHESEIDLCMNFLGFIPATPWSIHAFEGICIFVATSFLIAVTLPWKGDAAMSRILFWSVVVVIYATILSWIVASGIIERKFLPWGPLFMSGSVAIPIALGLSRIGAKIKDHIPISSLIAFQAFRLPLEIVLHDWYRSGTIPRTMTWEGSNWDILTGVLAICCLPFVGQRLWVAWAFNAIGILLLLNVVRVAVMSSPVPFGWNVEPPLELIVQLPYAFIVPVCVGGAFLGHVLLTRKLWKLWLHR